MKKDKLNLPIIKGKLPKNRYLSMDEYLEFVTFNLKHTVDIEAARKWKDKCAVNVPFKLK